MANLIIRKALASDAVPVWLWANDPETRKQSFNQEPIELHSHLKWFRAKLRDPYTELYIGMSHAFEHVGIVRFEVVPTNGYAVISVNVAPDQRGKGYGSKLIEMGCEKVVADHSNVSRIIAYIKPDNRSSMKVFKMAGFHFHRVDAAGGQKFFNFQKDM